MHTLLFVTATTGHNLTYARIILEALVANNIRCTLALPKTQEFEAEFINQIGEIRRSIDVLEYPQTENSKKSGFIGSWGQCKDFHWCIHKTGASSIIAPTGTLLPYTWGLYRRLALPLRKQSKISITLSMLSTGFVSEMKSSQTLASKIKQKLEQFARRNLLRLLPENCIATIDACAFERLKEQDRWTAGRFFLIPDPIIPWGLTNKITARQELDLDQDVFYVGLLGAFAAHPRKNLSLALEAIRLLGTSSPFRVLIAGKLGPRDHELLLTTYRDLLDSKFVRVIDKYLSDFEMGRAISAIDIACIPYSHHYAPSGIAAQAAAAGCPVIVPKYHWFDFAVATYGIGWTFYPLSSDALAKTLVEVASLIPDHQLSPEGKMWLMKSSVENFQKLWLQIVLQDYNN